MDLLKLFPNARLESDPVNQADYLSLPVSNQWLIIEKTTLTNRELALVENFLDKDPEPIQSPWQDFLFHGGFLPDIHHDRVRLVQLMIDDKGSDLDKPFWLDSVSHLFPEVVDLFFETNQTFYIIQADSDFVEADLAFYDSLVQTLEEDYGLKITAYLGQFWPTQAKLAKLWQEELRIFESQSQHVRRPVVDLAHLALAYYTEFNRHDSPILNQLHQMIKDNAQWLDIIDTLWKNQRNLTEAAKTLYLHRNTLQYRMDRFEDETGLSLKNMNDLTLAYIASLL